MGPSDIARGRARLRHVSPLRRRAGVSSVAVALLIGGALGFVALCFMAGDARGFASVEIRSPAEERAEREESRRRERESQVIELETCRRELEARERR